MADSSLVCFLSCLIGAGLSDVIGVSTLCFTVSVSIMFGFADDLLQVEFVRHVGCEQGAFRFLAPCNCWSFSCPQCQPERVLPGLQCWMGGVWTLGGAVVRRSDAKCFNSDRKRWTE